MQQRFMLPGSLWTELRCSVKWPSWHPRQCPALGTSVWVRCCLSRKITCCDLSEMIIWYPEGTRSCGLDCSLPQYLRTITKLLENRIPDIKESSDVLSSAAEEGDLTMDFHEDRNHRQEAPSGCPLPVTLLQQAAVRIILLSTSAKNSITKGDGNGRSLQGRTSVRDRNTCSSSSCRPAATLDLYTKF